LRAGGIAADLDAGSTVRREWAETGEIGRSQQTVTQTDPLTVCDQSNTLVALAANEENARQTHKNNALQYKHWPFWRHVGHSPISPTSAAPAKCMHIAEKLHAYGAIHKSFGLRICFYKSIILTPLRAV
jgi:hypothetical protein